jgi:uncharacterized iron-regulated membrane protein
MPRQWTWRHVRAVLLFRRGAAGRARDFNWHNVIGVWAAIPLVMIIWTGMAMHYPWARRATYKVAGTPIQTRPSMESDDADEIEQPVLTNDRFTGLDELLVRAEKQVPGWKLITIEIPDMVTDPVDFTIDMSGYDAVGKSADLTLDRGGQVVSYKTASAEGVNARSFIRYGHTGELWGIPGQTVAGVASLGGAFLVWTGIALSLRRWRNWRARRSRQSQRNAPPLSVARAA